MVIWLCGLSGSGKTTIGRLIYNRVKPKVPNLVLLDGEDLRMAFGNDLGHDQEGRRRNSLRIANLCQLLDRQYIHVICCAMTIAPEAQVANRRHIKEYYEIFLDVSLDAVVRRAFLGETPFSIHSIGGGHAAARKGDADAAIFTIRRDEAQP